MIRRQHQHKLLLQQGDKELVTATQGFAPQPHIATAALLQGQQDLLVGERPLHQRPHHTIAKVCLNPHRHLEAGRGFTKLAGEGVGVGNQPLGAGIEPVRRFGPLNPARLPNKQVHPQLILQRLDGGGEGGLGDEEAGCRRRDVALLEDSHKRTQGSHIHRIHLYQTVIKAIFHGDMGAI